MRFGSHSSGIALLVLCALACSPAGTPAGTPAAAPGATATPAAAQPSRTLVMALRVEPTSLASDLGVAGGATLNATERLFNAYLAMFDGQGNPQPYLAAALPQLNTESWVVHDDGSMETTYTLKPNLTWHDGSPLTADDFVFGSQVFASPDLGTAGAPPANLMDQVLAPDPATLTIHWKGLYAQAGELTKQFPPLPRHALESAFQTDAADSFAADPYWTTSFVGAGPYKLTSWTPGTSIEASAFSQHVLGMPKIDRLQLVFITDPQTLVTNMLAGEVQYASPDSSLGFQQGLALQQAWAAGNDGSVLESVTLWRAVFIQFRPDLLASPGLSDARVRQALALTMDKDAINQGIFEGQGIMSDVPFIPPTDPSYATVKPTVTTYPLDPNRAQTLLGDAGYTKGSDGVWASPTEGRLSFQLLTTNSTQNEAEQAILGSGWQQAGFDVNQSVMPITQALSGQARSSFPGLSAVSLPLGADILAASSTAGMSGPENNWTGWDRDGWTNPDFDRFSTAYSTTLDQGQRLQATTQMARIYTEQVSGIPMYFTLSPMAYVAALVGPQTVAPVTDVDWDIANWELR